LRHPFVNGKLAEWNYAKGEKIWAEGPICPVNSQHRVSIRSAQLKVLLRTSNPSDFIWCGYIECLLQAKVIDYFLQQGWSGFSIAPAECTLKSRSQQTKIQVGELRVLGYGGIASSPGLSLKETCECGREVYQGKSKGLKIDPQQWDGSDFFWVWPLPLGIIVTDRVAKALFKSGFTGFGLLPVEDFEFNGASPGRLADWLHFRSRENWVWKGEAGSLV